MLRMRTNALSQATEKGTPITRQNKGWRESKGGKRGSLRGRVRRLRRLRTGVSVLRHSSRITRFGLHVVACCCDCDIIWAPIYFGTLYTPILHFILLYFISILIQPTLQVDLYVIYGALVQQRQGFRQLILLTHLHTLFQVQQWVGLWPRVISCMVQLQRLGHLEHYSWVCSANYSMLCFCHIYPCT